MQPDRVDQPGLGVGRGPDGVIGVGEISGERGLKAGAADAFHAQAEHGAGRLGLQDLAEPPRSPLGHGDVCGHSPILCAPVLRAFRHRVATTLR